MTASSAVQNDLPIHEVRAEFREAIERGPVVLSAPTGSGKSTQVPIWCTEAVGPTLVVEPRRVACRALYRFLSADSGPKVGYVVRHERANPEADLLFVTPGVALRLLTEDSNPGRPCVVLDEFHERGMESDLLLALLAERPDLRLVVMSATMDSPRLASWLSAKVIEAKGRQYPVSVEYDGGVEIPSTRGLDDRVARAVRRATAFFDGERGDILVFLPGKAEIAASNRALRANATGGVHAASGNLHGTRSTDLEVIEFHAGMTGKQQDRAFRTPAGIRVVLATNVAESSVTLPWVRVVIDSGLERRTAGGARSCPFLPFRHNRRTSGPVVPAAWPRDAASVSGTNGRSSAKQRFPKSNERIWIPSSCRSLPPVGPQMTCDSWTHRSHAWSPPPRIVWLPWTLSTRRDA